MGCLNKITSSVRNTCSGGSTGVSELILLNGVDIASISVNKFVATLAMKAGTSAYAVDSIKKSINVTEASRINENAPNGLEDTVQFTIFTKDTSTKVAGATGAVNSELLNAIMNGKFVALAKMREVGVYRIYGAMFGLELESVNDSANDNGGYTTVTLKTPEGVLGELRLAITDTTYNTIKALIKD